MTAPDSPVLTVKEAAAYARCGTNHLYRALRTGEIAATQGGRPAPYRKGTWRIHRDALDAWLRGSSPEQASTKLKRVTPEPRRLRRSA
jgi:excisionase family DNA binding protein